jgi:Xaa-Pro aminopeptidase
MHPLERHAAHLVPAAEVHRRIRALQAHLQAEQIAVAWIDYLTDRYYFTGSIQEGTLLVPAEGEPEFFVRKSPTRAASETALTVSPFPGRKGLLAQLASRLRGGRLGLALDVTPAPTYIWLRDQLAGEPDDLSLAIRLQRAVKSEWELRQVRAAADQAITALTEIDRHLTAGITELELSASLEHRLRLLGHPGPLRIRRPGLELVMMITVAGDGGLYPTNFDGPDGAEGPYPSAAAGGGWRPIGRGETVMVDMVSAVNGYQADTARVYILGAAPPAPAQEAHRFCTDLLRKLEEGLRPGRVCAEIYEETLAWAEARGLPEGFMGFGENRVKFFGHGVGLDLDEFPILASRIDVELVPGMVVAMEPKAFLRGIGPVGAESTYVVTEAGCESLCPLPVEIRRLD